MDDQLPDTRVHVVLKPFAHQRFGIRFEEVFLGGVEARLVLGLLIGGYDGLRDGMNGGQGAKPLRLVQGSQHFRFVIAQFVDGVDQTDAAPERAHRGQQLSWFAGSAAEIALSDWEHLADGHLVVKGGIPLEEFVSGVTNQLWAEDGRVTGVVRIQPQSADGQACGEESPGRFLDNNHKTIERVGKGLRGKLPPIDERLRRPRILFLARVGATQRTQAEQPG